MRVLTPCSSSATARSRGKLVVSYLEGARASQSASEYFAYHLLQCDNIFSQHPTLRCEHSVPPSYSDCEPAAPQELESGRGWTRTTETLARIGTWGCSNEGGNGRVCHGAGAVPAQGVQSPPFQGDSSPWHVPGVIWPKTAWCAHRTIARPEWRLKAPPVARKNGHFFFCVHAFFNARN